MPRPAGREKVSSRIFKWIFLLMGVRIDTRNIRFEKYYAYVCIATYPFLLVPQFIPLITLNLLYHKMIVFVFLLSSSNIAAMTVWMHRNRHVVVAIYANVIRRDDLFDREYTLYFDSAVKRKMKQILFGSLILMSLVYATPLFTRFSSSSLTGEVDPIFMLFVPAWYPWAMDSTLSYSLTILFQLVSDFIASLNALGHVLCLHYFHALFQTMKLALIKKITSVERMRGAEDVDWILHDVIHSYGLLMRLMKTCAVIMKMYIFLATWSFFAAGAVLTIFQLLQSDTDFLINTARMISFQILFGANLIFCIQLSQFCYEVNDDIRMALYQTEWYGRSIRFRKTMIIFMVLLQRSHPIKALGVSTYVLTWSFITKMTKFTYSVLRVFLTIR